MPGRADREQSGRDTDPVSRQELQTEINELRTILRDAAGRLLYLQRRLNRLDPQTETAPPPAAAALAPADGAFGIDGNGYRGARAGCGANSAGTRPTSGCCVSNRPGV